MKQLLVSILLIAFLVPQFAQPAIEGEETPFTLTESSLSSADEAKRILDSVCEEYESFKSMKAKFVLNIKKNSFSTSDTIVGTVEGDKYRISMKHQEIASDGETVWYYHKEKKKVKKSTTNPAEVNTVFPHKMLRLYEKEYDFFLNGEASFNGQIIQKLEFLPRDFDQQIIRINVFVDKESNQLLRVCRYDKDGTTYTLDFRNVLYNIKVDPKIFILEMS